MIGRFELEASLELVGHFLWGLLPGGGVRVVVGLVSPQEVLQVQLALLIVVQELEGRLDSLAQFLRDIAPDCVQKVHVVDPRVVVVAELVVDGAQLLGRQKDPDFV